MQSLRFIIIPVIILGLGYLIYSQIKQPTAKTKKPPGIRKAPKTKVIELQVENYTSSIESNGIINAHNEVTLTSQVSGRIVKIHPQFEDGAFFNSISFHFWLFCPPGCCLLLAWRPGPWSEATYCKSLNRGGGRNFHRGPGSRRVPAGPRKCTKNIGNPYQMEDNKTQGGGAEGAALLSSIW